MNEKLQKNITLYIAIFLTIFTILPILAPILAHLGLTGFADIIYSIYQWLCHQRPWRSYHIFDYQYAMDARMMLMFGSMTIGAYIVHFKKIKPLTPKLAIFFAILMTVPLGIDGITQMIAEITSIKNNSIPFYESTNLIRGLTGLLLGTGFAFSLFPLLNVGETGNISLKSMAKYIFLSGVVSFLLIPIFVFLWQSTSSTYLPTSTFIDSTRRFPGYNYEITYGAGHSTIERIHKSQEIELFKKRAEKYERFDLIDEYNESLD